MMIEKVEPVRSKALRRSAQGQTCTLRIPGHCVGGTETTVLAHLPFGGRGMARKASDLHAVHACHGCHDALDARSGCRVSDEELYECCIRALAETMQRHVQAGLIDVRGNS